MFWIDERCVCCGACAYDCPQQCIVRKGERYCIGPSCIGCGDCYTICPVGAIHKRALSSKTEENRGKP